MNKKQSSFPKLLDLWEDRSKFKMHAVMSRKGQWFLIERDMSEKWPALFEIRRKNFA